MGPSVDSGPATNGIAIVVSGDGVNMPRIHTETSPECGCHGSRPAFVTVLDDSNATMRTSGPSGCAEMRGEVCGQAAG